MAFFFFGRSMLTGSFHKVSLGDTTDFSRKINTRGLPMGGSEAGRRHLSCLKTSYYFLSIKVSRIPVFRLTRVSHIFGIGYISLETTRFNENTTRY